MLMVPDLLLSLLAFAAVTTFTPGPNVLLVTASGANFGFRRTVPHMLGIIVGFPVMTIAIGLGLGEVFQAEPKLHVVLKYVATAYMLYLAWRIATSQRSKDISAKSRPMTFLEAIAFQWINPKAWIMAIGAIGAYTTVGGNATAETLMIALVFGVVSVPGVGAWALFGTAIGRFLRSDTAMRIFNVTMAILLVASLVPVFV